MSLISSLNISQQSLAINQAALSVISNNISNVDTPGYSKLKVNLASMINSTPSAGNVIAQANSLGGTELTNIERYSDAFLQNYSRKENSQYEYYNQYSTIASSIENLTNELNDSGLSSALSNFYDAANTLAQNASDPTARESYMQAAKNVTMVFNSTAQNLNDIKTSLVGDPNVAGSLQSSQIYTSVDSANSLIDQIASVNNDIIKTNSGEISSPSLLDQRDSLLKQLSALVPINATEQANGTVKVSLGDYELISGMQASNYLKVDQTTDPNNPVTISIVDSHGTQIAPNVNSTITSGSMGAILDATGNASGKLTVTNVLNSLDDMASGFAGVINHLQADNISTTSGSVTTTTMPLYIDASGKLTPVDQTNKIYMFTASDGTTTTPITAANINVNSSIVANTNLIAAARVDSTTTAPNYQNAVGNNSNMTLILASRSTAYPGDLNNKTVEGYLANMTGDVGTKVENINNNLKNQSTVMDSVNTKLTSETGVNLDEEFTDMIKFQRAYQASARVFSVCSSLLEELVNLGR